MTTIESAATLDWAARLDRRLALKTARIAVIGLGYVGLPTAQRFMAAGFRVIGFDSDRGKIAQLVGGQSYIRSVPGDRIAKGIQDGSFIPTGDAQQLSTADALLICVPTPLNASRDPDLSHVIETAQQVANGLQPGQLVVLESTTYPTTTRQVVLPILQGSGKVLGEEFFLAYSPEREDPGGSVPARDVPKVVGGMERRSLRLAEALYKHIARNVVPVSSCDVAEACKILENTYRAVNIALVNELKVLFERLGIDIWEVVDAARTKPFGFQAFYPGPGLGGHCIPVDPFYLSWLARAHGTATRFIELAGEINRAMPEYVVQRVVLALNDHCKPLRGSRVCVLGVAYKKDIDDPRESPALAILERLQRAGAILSFNDPFIARLPEARFRIVPQLESTPLTRDFLAQQDCVLIVTDHSKFDYQMIVTHAPLVVDTRGATRGLEGARTKVHPA